MDNFCVTLNASILCILEIIFESAVEKHEIRLNLCTIRWQTNNNLSRYKSPPDVQRVNTVRDDTADDRSSAIAAIMRYL